jgi:predicted type IV restriction endonuclease
MTTEDHSQRRVYDPIRRLYVAFTPEEAVRQAYVKHLLVNLNVPPVAVSVERKAPHSRWRGRYDIVVYRRGKCWMVVECKADTVEITEDVLYQAAQYNMGLQAQYIVLFNGRTEWVLRREGEQYVFCSPSEIPVYG